MVTPTGTARSEENPVATAEPIYDIAHLGHVELLTPDLQASAAFFTDVYGLFVEAETTDSIYLRAQHDHDRTTLKLTAAAQPGIGHLGWRTTSPHALTRRIRALHDAGVPMLADVEDPSAQLTGGIIDDAPLVALLSWQASPRVVQREHDRIERCRRFVVAGNDVVDAEIERLLCRVQRAALGAVRAQVQRLGIEHLRREQRRLELYDCFTLGLRERLHGLRVVDGRDVRLIRKIEGNRSEAVRRTDDAIGRCGILECLAAIHHHSAKEFEVRCGQGPPE